MIELMADGEYFPLAFTVDHRSGNTVILHDGDVVLSVSRNTKFNQTWDYVILRRKEAIHSV